MGLYVDTGLDLRAVRERTGLSLERIACELRRRGVRLRKRGARPSEHLDPERLRADYAAGASLEALAKREATAEKAVRAAIVHAGGDIRPPVRPRLSDGALSQAYLRAQYVRQHRTVRSIAEDVGCSTDSVASALKRHGIPTRHNTRRPSGDPAS